MTTDTQNGQMSLPITPDVTVKNGQAWTTSLAVAGHFRKQHKDVLRAIDLLKTEEETFHRRNFAPMSYMDQYGRSQRMVEMTRDGFAFVAMGFTGSEARRWKVAYIEAFNLMERELTSRARLASPPQAVRSADTYVMSTDARLAELEAQISEVRLLNGFLLRGHRLVRKELTTPEAAEIVRLYRSGAEPKAIARRLGRTVGTIHTFIRKARLRDMAH